MSTELRSLLHLKVSRAHFDHYSSPRGVKKFSSSHLIFFSLPAALKAGLKSRAQLLTICMVYGLGWVKIHKRFRNLEFVWRDKDLYGQA